MITNLILNKLGMLNSRCMEYSYLHSIALQWFFTITASSPLLLELKVELCHIVICGGKSLCLTGCVAKSAQSSASGSSEYSNHSNHIIFQARFHRTALRHKANLEGGICISQGKDKCGCVSDSGWNVVIMDREFRQSVRVESHGNVGQGGLTVRAENAHEVSE